MYYTFNIKILIFFYSDSIRVYAFGVKDVFPSKFALNKNIINKIKCANSSAKAFLIPNIHNIIELKTPYFMDEHLEKSQNNKTAG